MDYAAQHIAAHMIRSQHKIRVAALFPNRWVVASPEVAEGGIVRR